MSPEQYRRRARIRRAANIAIPLLGRGMIGVGLLALICAGIKAYELAQGIGS